MANGVLLVQVPNQAGPRSFAATPGERVACWFSRASVQILRRSDAVVPQLDEEVELSR